MYKRNSVYLLSIIFAVTWSLIAMKIPIISSLIESRVSEAVEKIRPQIEQNAIESARKSYISEELSGLSEVKKQIVLGAHSGNSPEQIFEKVWIAYRCVTMKANDIASLPFGLFKFNTDTAIEKNPILDMLKGKVNDRMSGYDLIERLTMHLELRGNAYAYFVGTPKLPIEIWPLLSQHVRPEVAFEDRNKILYYQDNYNQLVYQPKDIIHIMYLNPKNTTEGISPLEAASSLTEFSDKTAEFKNYMYENQAVPSGVLESPPEANIDDSQRKQLRREFDRYYSGVKNARRVMILSGGMKYSALGFNPRDMELLASEKLNWSMIPSAYGIPIELFGNLAEQKNYANMREATRHYYLFGLLPTGKKLFRALSRYFFPDMDFEFKILEDQINALRPTGDEIQNQYWTTPLEKRIRTGGDIPEDPERLAQLDKFYFPGNLTPVEDLTSDKILNNQETL